MQSRASHGNDSNAVNVKEPLVFFKRWPSSTTSKRTFWTFWNNADCIRNKSYEIIRISDCCGLRAQKDLSVRIPSSPPPLQTTRLG